MPPWMTPLLCVLVSRPGRGWRSITQTDSPRVASASADARPVTPAPMTATSICSMVLRVILSVEPREADRCLDHLRIRPVQFRELNMTKRALITGITGQDGSYLAELLLEKGYEVYGMIRRSSAPNLWRIQHIVDRVVLKPADLLDQLSLLRLVDE